MRSLLEADIVTRADVRVDRKRGWVTDKRYDSIVGVVTPDRNAADQDLWRAQAGDVSSWAWKREEAVTRVLELHNMQEKARAYDLASRRAVGGAR